MKQLQRDWIAYVAILLPVIYLGAIYSSLPQTVPVHWDLEGKTDGWGDKSMLWLTILLLPVLIYVIFCFVTKVDPKREIKNNTSLQRLKILLTVLMSLLCCYIIYSAKSQKISLPPFVIIGLVFIIMGNYMYSIKPNYFIGIRTPWTLENEEVWRKTHRISAPVWMIAGMALCLVSLFAPYSMAALACTAISLAVALFSVIYSYMAWKKLK